MPSLPALPAKSSAFKDTSAFTALYSKATRQYLSRDFSSALSTIALARGQQLSLKHKKKAFLLYLAILDSFTSFSERDASHKLGPGALNATSRLKSGAIWSEAESDFGGRVPNEVAVSIILSLTRHMSDSSALQDQVESLLTTLEPDSSEHDSISEIYALHVLPRCNEWETSAIYIESCDMSDEKRQSWLVALDKIQQAQEEQRKAALREAEDNRLAEAEAKKLRKVRKSRASGSKRSATSVNGSVDPSTESSGIILPKTKKDDTVAKPGIDPVISAPGWPSRGALSALSSWTRLLATRFSPRVMRVLFFLVVLFGATGRREVRERLQTALRKVGSTLSAGFKVSYI